MRLFLGLSLPAVWIQEIHNMQSQLSSDIAWIPDENLHITVAFFGEVADVLLPNLQEMIRVVVKEVPAFDLSFHSYKLAPLHQTPRMLWANIQKSRSFTQSVHIIDRAYQQIHPNQFNNRRSPQPHINLLRASAEALLFIQPQLADLPADFPTLPVSEMVLWESLQGKTYPTYREIARFVLKK